MLLLWSWTAPLGILLELGKSDLSVSKDGAMAARGLQYGRRRLEVKPSYSHEEVKSLMFHFIKQAQELEAENQNLQSSSVATS